MQIMMTDTTPCHIPWQPRSETETGQPVWRYDGNPILGWNPTKSTARVFNSSVVPYQGGFIGVFRADSKRINPRLHLGRSTDGLNWQIDDEPIRWRDVHGNSLEEGTFSYDPRLIAIDGVYYIVWCCDFYGYPALGLGVTKNFQVFTRMQNPFLPFNRNGVLFPRKINGKYLLLSRPSDNGHTPFGDIYLSESPDLAYWGNHRLVMRAGTSWWQSLKIGAGSVPIETDKGWLLFYHGVINNCNGYVYSMGAALLDLEDPSKVLLRSRDYLLTPERDYEINGFVPNVCFPCGELHDPATGRITLYYGAADTYMAVAFTTVADIYQFLLDHGDN